ncbi:hypothetical protein ACS0TY_000696 [Phlomoides rotata]
MDSSNSGEGSSMKYDCISYIKTHELIRWKSGKRVDPRLLALLESFEEIYSDRHEFFKKIFDEEEHNELFKKIGDALKRKKQMKKVRSLPRSRSMRAIGKREINEIDEMRNERFKIRPPNVIVVEPDDTNN